MADCKKLLKNANAARSNWQVKHKVSCKGAGHSSQCKAAYAYYTKKLAAQASACAKRTVDLKEEDMSTDERHALEKELDMARDSE